MQNTSSTAAATATTDSAAKALVLTKSIASAILVCVTKDDAKAKADAESANSIVALGLALRREFKPEQRKLVTALLIAEFTKQYEARNLSIAGIPSRVSTALTTAFPKVDESIAKRALERLNAPKGDKSKIQVGEYNKMLTGSLKETKAGKLIEVKKADKRQKEQAKPLDVFKNKLALLGSEPAFASAIDKEQLTVALVEFAITVYGEKQKDNVLKAFADAIA